jgi:anti-sigma factor ChrR (cupin superfamily)
MIVDPALPWEPFRDGVEIHRLYSTPDGRSAAFLRYAPGATLPRHHHIGLEHILILTGSQQDERGSYQAGTLLVHPPGTSHTVRSRGGCVVLALWERPVVFE